jgi:hypothetical protein
MLQFLNYLTKNVKINSKYLQQFMRKIILALLLTKNGDYFQTIVNSTLTRDQKIYPKKAM